MKQREEEEKKEIRELNKNEEEYSEQILRLVDIGFENLKANISALTTANGNLDQAIDILIAESMKP